MADRAEGYAMGHANDDRSPLIDLLTCIACKVTMKIEKSDPDENGSDLVQYRCELCRRQPSDSLGRLRRPP